MATHPIIVERFIDQKEMKNCHILFINLTDTSELFSSLRHQSVLTVSDHDLNKDGGIIRFFTRNNKVRLAINVLAAKEARLGISSKLLRLAEIIEE